MELRRSLSIWTSRTQSMRRTSSKSILQLSRLLLAKQYASGAVIAGFNSRFDRIAPLNTKLKVHSLLRQAGLDMHTRNVTVGASSVRYDVTSIYSALRQAYRKTPRPSSMTLQPTDLAAVMCSFCQKNRHLGKDCFKRLRKEKEIQKVQMSVDTLDTFLTSPTDSVYRSIVVSGACSSVVGKEALESVLKQMGLESVHNASPKLQYNRFGKHKDDHRSLFPVEFALEQSWMQTLPLNSKCISMLLRDPCPSWSGFLL